MEIIGQVQNYGTILQVITGFQGQIVSHIIVTWQRIEKDLSDPLFIIDEWSSMAITKAHQGTVENSLYMSNPTPYIHPTGRLIYLRQDSLYTSNPTPYIHPKGRLLYVLNEGFNN